MLSGDWLQNAASPKFWNPHTAKEVSRKIKREGKKRKRKRKNQKPKRKYKDRSPSAPLITTSHWVGSIPSQKTDWQNRLSNKIQQYVVYKKQTWFWNLQIKFQRLENNISWKWNCPPPPQKSKSNYPNFSKVDFKPKLLEEPEKVIVYWVKEQFAAWKDL